MFLFFFKILVVHKAKCVTIDTGFCFSSSTIMITTQ